MQPWIQTISGKKFDYADPTPEMIDIGDIAIALSRQPRFVGHTSDFYSVAQHSVLVSTLVQINGGTRFQQMIALLHDATEAYIGDMAAPLKSIVPQFREIEERIWKVICISQFDSQYFELPECVKHADAVALATEARDLFDFEPIDNWVERLPAPHVHQIKPLDAVDSWVSFRQRYKELFGVEIAAIKAEQP